MSAMQPMILALAAIVAGAIEFAMLLRLLRKYIDPMKDDIEAFFRARPSKKSGASNLIRSRRCSFSCSRAH
jgi:hypothetical protein